jgi:hypothetical protein
MRRRFTFRFVTTSALLDLYRASYGRKPDDQNTMSSAQIDHEYSTCDVLCLDELGGETIRQGEAGAWAREQIMKLVESRINAGRTILGTTNLRQWPLSTKGADGKPTGRYNLSVPSLAFHYGEKLASRLFAATVFVGLTGPDRRQLTPDPFADIAQECEGAIVDGSVAGTVK